MATVRDLMTSDVETIGPDQTAREAAAFMLSADTGSIPVCENDKVIGMITDRDIAVRGVAEGRSPDCRVRDLMSSDVICARDTDDAQSVAQRMSDAQVRRLPVLDQGNRIVGMISLGDLSREGKQEAASQALEGVSASGGQHQQA
ncbi:MAG: CBS domain-containing protein [Sphingomonas sp.]|uniref:CBS domain-containing protein n=1 Tax=Sphingomonas sp. TaxID=28214 RepID=UPI0017E7D58A|nr:CBS domain-containing protein [Sphingomonas sp.]MBA3667179.1 CBS domain-containing protein [Sphingomonas sp.]